MFQLCKIYGLFQSEFVTKIILVFDFFFSALPNSELLGCREKILGEESLKFSYGFGEREFERESETFSVVCPVECL